LLLTSRRRLKRGSETLSDDARIEISLRHLNSAEALHSAYYNFVKIHSTLETTPAMTAGITTKLWEIEDLLALLD
jgi:hypothetical protein